MVVAPRSENYNDQEQQDRRHELGKNIPKRWPSDPVEYLATDTYIDQVPDYYLLTGYSVHWDHPDLFYYEVN